MPETGYPAEGTEVQLIYLTFWDKVLILAGAIGFLLIVAFCLVCVLCPDCLLHSVCCSGDEDTREKKKRNTRNASKKSTSSYGSVESDYYYGAPPDGGKWRPLEILKEHDVGHSDWSSDTGTTAGEETIQLEQIKNKLNVNGSGLQNGDGHLSDSESPLESGTLSYALRFSPEKEKLTIKVLEVQDALPSGGRELVSPYVKIRLYRTPKQFFKFRSSSVKDHVINNLENELKTKMQRPNGTLAYKETFEVQMQAETLAQYTVKFLLCDMDKLSRQLILGETSAILRKLDMSTENTFVNELEAPKEENLGSIRLGLSYLPTAEKMYLSVESASGLNVMDKVTGSTDSCVKAYLMYDGKQLKRVKTTVRAADLNPVFNETFSFDVPQNDLGHVYLSLVTCHYDAEKKSTKVIGRVYLGMIFDAESRDHWISMMCNPRKKIVNTYKLLS